MDWATATFFDRMLHFVWLDPDLVRAKFDVEGLRNSQRPMNEALMNEWSTVAPGSNASIVEFDFHITANAKRKLRRRFYGHHIKSRRGGLILREAISLKLLSDYSLAYEIAARECGGALLRWYYVASPLTD